MENLHFFEDKKYLEKEYVCPRWIENSGMTNDELIVGANTLVQKHATLPAILLRAKLFEFLFSHARLSFDSRDVFVDLVDGENIAADIRTAMTVELLNHGVCKKEAEERKIHLERGDYLGGSDFGHASPDWNALLTLGYTGLLERNNAERAKKQADGTLSKEQAEYYQSVEISYTALLSLLARFSQTVKENANGSSRTLAVAERLSSLSQRPPQTFAEALQLIVFTYRIFSRFEGCYVRSLGGLDRNLLPFYQRDLANGTADKAQLDEYVKYFYEKFIAQNIFANVPFFIGGVDAEGKCAVNELSYVLIQNYVEMNVFCPKIHFRLCKDFPEDLLRLALHSICQGNSSFLFINDDVVIPSLEKLGESQEDARNYTIIGCYEPAAEGKEMPSSCNGLINLPKILELTLSGGEDLLRLKRVSPSQEGYPYATFELLYASFQNAITDAVKNAMEITSAYERNYPLMTSAPFTSATFFDSVTRGKDVYHGGAKYNNSGLNIIGFATAIDSLIVLKRFVYDEKRFTLTEFSDVLKANWQGYEEERLQALSQGEKFGNGDNYADQLYQELYAHLTSLFANQPNGRGGKFRLGLFSVDNCFSFGKAVAATPNGRLAREPISKNLCATQGADKNGVTALMQSVTKIDFTDAPNGEVLDVILHPSAVAGEDGLDAFAALVKAFVAMGGFAVHFNVFSKEQLVQAQKEPQKYATLQVRLCGWNAYFVDLPKEQQDSFIAAMEN